MEKLNLVSSTSSTQGRFWWNMTSKGLEQLYPIPSLVAAHMASDLGWVCSMLLIFSAYISHSCHLPLPGVSASASLSKVDLSSQGSTGHAWAHSQSADIWVEASVAPQILHSPCLQNQHHMHNVKYATSLSSNWVLLDHDYSGLSVPCWLSTVKLIVGASLLGVPSQIEYLMVLFQIKIWISTWHVVEEKYIKRKVFIFL